MNFDIATLFAVSVVATGLGGLLLLFAWLQARSTTALAWWGLAFVLFAPAGALCAARGAIPDFLSLQVATAIMVLGYAMMWTGARVFEGRKPLVLPIAAGWIVWLAAFQIEAFAQSMAARAGLASVLVGAYSFAFVYELWRGRHDRLVSRWPIMIIVSAHAVAFPFRTQFVRAIPFPLGSSPASADVSALLVFAPLLYSFAMVFLLMALTKERAESNQRYAATIDPLTGIPNRRGFGERAERMLARAQLDRTEITLLLFDLDRFKSINDRFGHRTGDEVLALFGNCATQSLRPLDLVGRIGGEEFVALLPGVGADTAPGVAERVRDNFAAAAHTVNGFPVAATVSIGTACTAHSGYSFDALYASADAALYRAKKKGRNRIEVGMPIAEPAKDYPLAMPAGARAS